MLSQYRLCAAGIGLGTAYSLKYKKGLVPMVAAGAVGTTADMVSTEDSNLKKNTKNYIGSQFEIFEWTRLLLYCAYNFCRPTHFAR